MVQITALMPRGTSGYTSYLQKFIFFYEFREVEGTTGQVRKAARNSTSTGILHGITKCVKATSVVDRLRLRFRLPAPDNNNFETQV